MSLPIFQSKIQELMLLQTKWVAQLNPLLGNPISNPSILKGINLTTGKNVINHGLGAQQQGWVISDITAPVTVYRSAPFNDTTLTLTSSGAATVNLLVY